MRKNVYKKCWGKKKLLCTSHTYKLYNFKLSIVLTIERVERKSINFHLFMKMSCIINNNIFTFHKCFNYYMAFNINV